jgi:hypothetical protein
MNERVLYVYITAHKLRLIRNKSSWKELCLFWFVGYTVLCAGSKSS